MDAVKFFHEKNRMCLSYSGDCDYCPLGRISRDNTMSCYYIMNHRPDIAVDVIEQWSEEHPLITKDKVMNILREWENFFGHRDGIELWTDSTKDIQDKIIENFNQSMKIVKKWVKKSAEK